MFADPGSMDSSAVRKRGGFTSTGLWRVMWSLGRNRIRAWEALGRLPPLGILYRTMIFARTRQGWPIRGYRRQIWLNCMLGSRASHGFGARPCHLQHNRLKGT